MVEDIVGYFIVVVESKVLFHSVTNSATVEIFAHRTAEVTVMDDADIRRIFDWVLQQQTDEIEVPTETFIWVHGRGWELSSWLQFFAIKILLQIRYQIFMWAL